MNRTLSFAALLFVGFILPLCVSADDLASSTPETLEPALDVAPAILPLEPVDMPAAEVASTSPGEIPLADVASTSEPVATSSALLIPSDPAPSTPSPVSITLALETQEDTLFSGSLTVTACASAPDAPLTVSGYCAIEQSGTPAAWSWYGSDAFIDTIGGVGNDYAGGVYWNWFSDLTYGMTSLNAHELHPGESLVVSIGRFPLRVTATPEESVVGSTTTIAVSAFAFDAHFEPIWEPVASSTVLIHGVPYLSAADGTVSYVPTEPGTWSVTATKDGFLPATGISILVQEASVPDPGTDGEGGGQPPANAVDSALGFLRAHQRADGSFASPLLSDWAAIAFASANAPSRPLKQHLASIADPLASATDFERRAMALAAMGINPRKEIEEIVERFDGTQVGERSLVNDDIFALIALSHGGYTSSDPIIKALAATLVESQHESGAWISTDLTAAGIQALVPFSSLPGVSAATDKARSYLASRINADGCFGNSFATSWGLMAIHALGESPDTWSSPTGATPLSCLKAAQAADGGFEEGASTDMRVWATAYAVPALSGKSWDDVLKRYPKSEGATEETKKAEEAEPLLEEVPETVATTTLPLPLEPETLEVIAPLIEMPNPPVPLAKETPEIAGSALAASVLAATEHNTATEASESLWTLLMNFMQSLLALLFQTGTSIS